MVGVIIAGLGGAVVGFGVGFPAGYACGARATQKRIAKASLILRGLAPDAEAVRAEARGAFGPHGTTQTAADAAEKRGGLTPATLLSEEGETYKWRIGPPPPAPAVAAGVPAAPVVASPASPSPLDGLLERLVGLVARAEAQANAEPEPA
jgi:hypothetical protein